MSSSISLQCQIVIFRNLKYVLNIHRSHCTADKLHCWERLDYKGDYKVQNDGKTRYELSEELLM